MTTRIARSRLLTAKYAHERTVWIVNKLNVTASEQDRRSFNVMNRGRLAPFALGRRVGRMHGHRRDVPPFFVLGNRDVVTGAFDATARDELLLREFQYLR